MSRNKYQTKRHVPGHLRTTDRATYRMITSEDDPLFSQLTMAFSMRQVPSKKKATSK